MIAYLADLVLWECLVDKGRTIVPGEAFVREVIQLICTFA